MPTDVDAIETTVEAIREYRERYRKEMACQIVHDSWHARGFVTSYFVRINGEIAGYGSVGGSPGDPRDTVKEMYLLPEHRAAALPCFDALVAATDAKAIAAQTNDRLLTVLLFDRAEDLTSDTILFDDRLRTHLTLAPGALFRQIHESDDIVFTHGRCIRAVACERDAIRSTPAAAPRPAELQRRPHLCHLCNLWL